MAGYRKVASNELGFHLLEHLVRKTVFSFLVSLGPEELGFWCEIDIFFASILGLLC